MTHYLHHDDEAKQDAQMKRIKRRAKYARQATGKWAFVRMKQPGLSEIRRSRDQGRSPRHELEAETVVDHREPAGT